MVEAKGKDAVKDQFCQSSYKRATSLSAEMKLTAIKDTKLPRAVRASGRVSGSIPPPPCSTPELAFLGAFSRLHSSNEEHGTSTLEL